MPAMHPISRREWLFPLLLTLFFALAGSAPYLYGAFLATPEQVFMGFVGRDTMGANSYFAFARQVAEGHDLVTNLYTPESPSRAYFNLEWWTMGALARQTGLSLAFLFHTGRILTALVFLLSVYYLCAVVLDKVTMRRAGLLLIALGSGFGWLVWLSNYFLGTTLAMPWDVQGVSPFAYLMNKPHFMRAGAIAALQYAWFIRGDQTGRPAFFAASGLAAAGHSLIRPYQIPEAVLFLLLYGIARSTGDWRAGRGARLGAALCGLCQAPAIAWHAWVYVNNPLGLQGLHAWYPILVLQQILWFGLPFAAILVHLAWLCCRGRAWRNPVPVLALWILAAMALLQASPYFPFAVESYFAWVLAPPLLFLRYTWPRCRDWLGRSSGPARTRGLAVAGVCLCVLPSSVMAYADFFHDLHVPDGAERHYIHRDLVAAAEWIEANAQAEPVVLASLETSQFLPRLADLRVVSGQDALSVNYLQKNRWVCRFFISWGDDGFKQWLCEQEKVTHVIFGPFEEAFAAADMRQHTWLEPVYTEGTVTVYAKRR